MILGLEHVRTYVFLNLVASLDECVIEDWLALGGRRDENLATHYYGMLIDGELRFFSDANIIRRMRRASQSW